MIAVTLQLYRREIEHGKVNTLRPGTYGKVPFNATARRAAQRLDRCDKTFDDGVMATVCFLPKGHTGECE